MNRVGIYLDVGFAEPVQVEVRRLYCDHASQWIIVFPAFVEIGNPSSPVTVIS